MNRSAIGLLPRTVVLVIAATALLFALPAVVSADGPNGVAVKGPEVEFAVGVVVPVNVQVDPSGNASQTATNTSNMNQAAIAGSGNASASNGGVAVSGAAVAGAVGVVTQLNIQVNACMVSPNQIVQTALNAANVNQASIALSGNASASGPGTVAISGRATAIAVAAVHQQNVQVYTCH
jgi:hypothetical protein